MDENHKRFKVGTSGKERGFCGGDVQESVRASLHGRDAYEKGYSDGKKAAMDELVRCKDCKHCIRLSHIDPDEVRCGKLQSDYIKPNDFCSYGERREGE